ncbi:hypothetical protein FCH28_10300 [Streptomyces piniterrae]|uniref:Uncharacterized protein n=1 Tax=Streptomyces piniterrae TaxID=2571125 RepID=A0A4U0NP97_9ACTN|nr:hypothetical protein [Streptomyces piniterrae]TJZ55702.1 hypothetical protein FCH28_10300 [Streptomyces piniterrae]
MTTETRTAVQAAADAYRDPQLALTDAEMTFPEPRLGDTAEGDIRINFGPVGIRTAARPARILKAVRS